MLGVCGPCCTGILWLCVCDRGEVVRDVGVVLRDEMHVAGVGRVHFWGLSRITKTGECVGK
jgi:hypothetical protein